MNNQDTEITKTYQGTKLVQGIRQESIEFLQQSIQNVIFHQDTVLPALHKVYTEDHLPTNSILRILNILVDKGTLNLEELKQIDITAQKLARKNSALPDLIKYGFGINWPAIDSSIVLWNTFVSRYSSLKHTTQTVLFYRGVGESAIREKIENFWQVTRRARISITTEFIFGENEESKNDASCSVSDIDEPYQNGCELLTSQFFYFVKEEGCHKNLQFKEAYEMFKQNVPFQFTKKDENDFKSQKTLHRYQQRVQRYKAKKQKQDTRKDWEKNGQSIVDSLESPDKLKMGDFPNVFSECFIDFRECEQPFRVGPNSLQSKMFYEVTETPKFRNWFNLEIRNRRHIPNQYEHDVDSDLEEVQRGIDIMTRELDETVYILIRDNPIDYVTNVAENYGAEQNADVLSAMWN